MAENELKSKRAAVRMRALTLFATHGFEQCTLERLCTEFGTSQAEFLELYESPIALFRAVYHEVSQGGLRAIITGLMIPGSSSERIDSSARALVDYFNSDQHRAIVFAVEAPNISRAFSEECERIYQDYADVIISGMKLTVEMNLSDTQIRIGTLAIVTAMTSLIRELVKDSKDATRADVAVVLSHLCRTAAGLGPDIS